MAVNAVHDNITEYNLPKTIIIIIMRSRMIAADYLLHAISSSPVATERRDAPG